MPFLLIPFKWIIQWYCRRRRARIEQWRVIYNKQTIQKARTVTWQPSSQHLIPSKPSGPMLRRRYSTSSRLIYSVKCYWRPQYLHFPLLQCPVMEMLGLLVVGSRDSVIRVPRFRDDTSWGRVQTVPTWVTRSLITKAPYSSYTWSWRLQACCWAVMDSTDFSFCKEKFFALL
jgi:hypothetical protein